MKNTSKYIALVLLCILVSCKEEVVKPKVIYSNSTKLIEQPKEDKDKMYVLDEKGNIQMSLYGNERIFSRNSTKVLVKKAKKAYKSKSDSDYLSLGKYLFKEINKHNTQDEEYVEIKE